MRNFGYTKSQMMTLLFSTTQLSLLNPPQKKAQLFLMLCGLSLIHLQCAQAPLKFTSKDDPLVPLEPHFKALHQVTQGALDDRVSWSFNGAWLTFQRRELSSSKGGEVTACDQAYKVKPSGKGLQKLSQSKSGAFNPAFLPGDKRISFNSAESQRDKCIPNTYDSLNRVDWLILPSQKIYTLKTDGTDLLPLDPGAPTLYHADASFCKDGSVAFAAEDQGDIELYIGKLDNLGTVSGIQKITDRAGFDGEVTFSPDCKKIAWVAAPPQKKKEALPPQKRLEGYTIRPPELEIWTANGDGTDAHAITHFGAISVSPTFSPNSSKIVFASNLSHPRKKEFSLYQINIDGTELELISRASPYEGSPRFSPDGRYLAFTSQRNATTPEETSIFIAEWAD